MQNFANTIAVARSRRMWGDPVMTRSPRKFRRLHFCIKFHVLKLAFVQLLLLVFNEDEAFCYEAAHIA